MNEHLTRRIRRAHIPYDTERPLELRVESVLRATGLALNTIAASLPVKIMTFDATHIVLKPEGKIQKP
jgi:hypothetical protein